MTTPAPTVVALPIDTPDDTIAHLNTLNQGVIYVRQSVEAAEVSEGATPAAEALAPVAEAGVPISDTVAPVDTVDTVTAVPVDGTPAATPAVPVEPPVEAAPEAAVFASATDRVTEVAEDATKAVEAVDSDASRVGSVIESVAPSASVDKDTATLVREIHALATDTQAKIAEVERFIGEFTKQASGSPIGKMLGL